MSLRWQEVVVLPEESEMVRCDCCGAPARRIEGSLLHREEPVGRYTARWRPGERDHACRFVLYLGDWGGRRPGERSVAAADLVPGLAGGFVLRDDTPRLMRALAPWRPRFVRRAEAIGKPLGQRIFALLDAVVVKDQRLRELREWSL